MKNRGLILLLWRINSFQQFLCCSVIVCFTFAFLICFSFYCFIAAIVADNLIKHDVLLILVKSLIQSKWPNRHIALYATITSLINEPLETIHDALLSNPKTIPLIITLIHSEDPSVQGLGVHIAKRIVTLEKESKHKKYKKSLLKDEKFQQDLSIISQYTTLNPHTKHMVKDLVDTINLGNSDTAAYLNLSSLSRWTFGIACFASIWFITRRRINNLIHPQWELREFPQLEKVWKQTKVALLAPIFIASLYFRPNKDMASVMEKYMAAPTQQDQLKVLQQYQRSFAYTRVALAACFLLSGLVTFSPLLYVLYVYQMTKFRYITDQAVFVV